MFPFTLQVLGVTSWRSVYQVLADGLVTGSSYALLGVAFALILGVTRRFHFAFALVYTVSAYVAAVVAGLSVPLALALFAGLAAAALLACAIELAVYRPIVRRTGDHALLEVFVAGLGLTIAGANLLRLWGGNDARVLEGLPDHAIGFGGVKVTTLELFLVLIAGLVIVALAVVLERTSIGHQVKGVRDNPDMALAVGINVQRTFLVVFVVGSVIAGLAALFDGMRFAVTPDMGSDPVFYALVVAFLAGATRSPLVVGAVGLGLGLVTKLSTLWVSENLSALTVFGLLTVVLTARVLPQAVRQLSSSLSRTHRAPTSRPAVPALSEV